MDNSTLDLYFNNRTALEIGGPSRLLQNFYLKLKSIDHINNVSSMKTFAHINTEKNIYDCDATTKNIHLVLEGKKYNLLILSHTFEHIANPIKALKNWLDLLTEESIIINIVPDKNFCWDRNREYTTFEHILNDFNSDISENDMTHLHESSCMVETRPQYYSEVGNYNEHRIIHHHVFSKNILKQVHEFAGFNTIICDNKKDDLLQLVYIGSKK